MILENFSTFNKKETYIRFSFFLFIMFMFIFPIIHANFYYQDDYYRALNGINFMGKIGRFLSYIVFSIPSMKKHPIDTAPLFQILSIFATSFSLTALSLSWRMNRLSSFILLPLIFCFPFFLSDISYRFDSLTISLSVSLVVLSFCYIESHTTYITVILLLASLNLYQASISVFLVLSCLLSFSEIQKKDNAASCKLYLKSLCCLVFALLIYKLQLFTLGLKGYGAEHGELSFHLASILYNAKHFAALAFSEFGLYGGSLETILGIILILGFIKGIYDLFPNGPLSILLGSVYILLAVLSLSGIMFLLREPVFISRTMIANGALLSFAVFCLIGPNAKFLSFQRILVILGGWALFIQISIAFQWGNLAHNQALWEEKITAKMVDDLYAISGHSKSKIFVRILPYHTVSLDELSPDARHDIRAETYDRLNFPMQSNLIYHSKIYHEGSSTVSEVILPLVYDVPTAPLTARIWHSRPSLNGDRHFLFSDPPWGHIALVNDGLPDNIIPLVSFIENKDFPLKDAEEMRHNCHYSSAIDNIFYGMYREKDKVVVDFSHACFKPNNEHSSTTSSP